MHFSSHFPYGIVESQNISSEIVFDKCEARWEIKYAQNLCSVQYSLARLEKNKQN